MMQQHADQMSYKLQRRLKKWRVKLGLLDVLHCFQAEFGRIPADFFFHQIFRDSQPTAPRKVHQVPWALPPGMVYIKKVTKYDGWCGKMEPSSECHSGGTRRWVDKIQGKSTGIHRCSNEIWDFPVIFPLNQSTETRR